MTTRSPSKPGASTTWKCRSPPKRRCRTRAAVPGLWDDLASDDSIKANVALWKLVGAGEPGIKFVADKVAAVENGTEKATGIQLRRAHRAVRIVRARPADHSASKWNASFPRIPEYGRGKGGEEMNMKLGLQVISLWVSVVFPPLFIWVVVNAQREFESYRWPSVIGEVQETVAMTSPGSDGEILYYGRVLYSYVVNGKQYSKRALPIRRRLEEARSADGACRCQQLSARDEAACVLRPRRRKGRSAGTGCTNQGHWADDCARHWVGRRTGRVCLYDPRLVAAPASATRGESINTAARRFWERSTGPFGRCPPGGAR